MIRRNNIPQDILDERITEIKILCDRFINRITSDEMIKKMPRPLRAICGFTRLHAEKYNCKNISALIGGFLMLRYIAPSIVTPESFGVSDDVPTVKSRANLVIIAKILQNISNCIRFEDSKKEYHMRVFDEYVISRITKLAQYYKKISHDPETENNHIPWYDFLKPLDLEPEQIPLDKIGIQELFTIHRLIYQYRTKIVAGLEGHDVLINLINELGPPPSVSMNIQKKSFSKSSYSMENFFYQGKPNKIGNPVFYLIVCRMDFTLFDNIEQLVTHIFQTITNAVGPTTEVSLVIDMSWASREDLRNSFLKSTSELSKIPSLINLQDKKRVKQIHLIHPLNINRVLLVFLKATTKRKTYNKIFEHEKWKTLAKYIDLDKIALPDESKSFITKAYRVIKINAKGKKQNRVVKFTANSILNIDPKSKILKNEKLLTDIENISVTKDGEIILNFSSESIQRDANKKKGMFLSLSNKADLETRKYICENRSESEKFMEDIFEAALHATKLQCPQQQFKVIKVNFAGKHQERLFKLTCDSLLNLDGRKIRTEISYAGIKDIYVDKFDPRTLFILLKSETATRKIICANESERNNLYYMLARKVLEAQGELDIEESELRHGSTELYRTTINMEK